MPSTLAEQPGTTIFSFAQFSGFEYLGIIILLLPT
jgi:hypothetical protein